MIEKCKEWEVCQYSDAENSGKDECSKQDVCRYLNAEKGERCPNCNGGIITGNAYGTPYPILCSLCHGTGKPSADDEMAKNCVVCKKPLSVNGHKYLCDVCLIQYSDKPSAMGEDNLTLLIAKELYEMEYSHLTPEEANICKKLAHAIAERMKI